MTVFWSFAAIKEELTKDHDYEPIFYLGRQEREYLDSLRFEKRRSEWLAGRIALKHLLLAANPVLSQHELPTIQILKTEDGAPYLLIDGDPDPNHKISLSHSNGYVFCAYSNEHDHLGVDLERVEKRPQDFMQDFFTPDELCHISRRPSENHPLLATLIWSAKEAVLKALSVGLKVDTRKVNIHVESSKPSTLGWNSLRFTTNLFKETMHLYWRREIEFVLTACVEEHQPTRFARI
jgi:phosphopantetheinyl transferase